MNGRRVVFTLSQKRKPQVSLILFLATNWHEFILPRKGTKNNRRERRIRD